MGRPLKVRCGKSPMKPLALGVFWQGHTSALSVRMTAPDRLPSVRWQPTERCPKRSAPPTSISPRTVYEEKEPHCTRPCTTVFMMRAIWIQRSLALTLGPGRRRPVNPESSARRVWTGSPKSPYPSRRSDPATTHASLSANPGRRVSPYFCPRPLQPAPRSTDTCA